MKKVLITGAGGGLGRALVLKFLSAGYRVFAAVRDEASGRQLFGAESDSNLQLLALDLTNYDSIKSVSKIVNDQYGGIDVLINNAAIAVPSVIEEVDAGVIDKVMATNFTGALNLIQLLLPGMRARKAGRIINVSSLSAHLGLPGDGLYSASKAALERACESLKSELLPFNVQVSNAIPGKINTPLTQKMQENFVAPEDSAYAELHQQLQKELLASDSGGSEAAEIAAEIVSLAEQAQPAFFAPVGDQARAVMALLAGLSEEERNALIREYSCADWWASQRS